MPYDLPWLFDQSNPEFCFFWGHTPPADGSINQSCFSQWFARPFVIDRIRYATAEHWMMAEKARCFNDTATLTRILASTDPKEAKRWGRRVTPYLDEVWAEHRYRAVVAGNYEKFRQHDDLRTYLMGTEDRVLVEASPYDRIWGIGLSKNDPRAQQPQTWAGQNLLGFALMEVRERLRGY